MTAKLCVDVAPAVITHLAAQIGVSVEALDGYAWVGRSGRRHRVAIIDHLAVAAFDEAAEGQFRHWLADDVLPREFGPSVLDEELSGWFARSRVTRPGAYRLGRIMRSAQAAYDDAALRRVAERLNIGMRERLGALLADDGDGTAYARLAADPGRVGLESLLAEIAIWPVLASTPRCSLRHDRRVRVPCFSINHSPAPHSFKPVLSTSKCRGCAPSPSPTCGVAAGAQSASRRNG